MDLNFRIDSFINNLLIPVSSIIPKTIALELINTIFPIIFNIQMVSLLSLLQIQSFLLKLFL